MVATTDGANTVILRAFLANLGIAVAKFAGAAITGSSAMMTEGVHSLVDTVNEALLAYGRRRARLPADELHPLGYAREQYFWSFVVALLVFTLGAGVALYEGVAHWLHPVETERPAVALGILGIAALLEGWSLVAAVRAFNRARGDLPFLRAVIDSRDTTTLSVMLEDAAAVCGLFIAASGIGLELLTRDPRWDALASILIAFLLGVVAIILLAKAKHLLIGQTASPEIARALRAIAAAQPGVTAVVEVLTIQQSVDAVLAVMRVDFDDGIEGAQVERIVGDIARDAQKRLPAVSRLFVSPFDTRRAASQTGRQQD
ncbi:MAG: cation diffusion facilitator family transporter [Hyphomicrobiales bacterium]|nr:cation diffusion facilitator family transporter [Hyphomicrobiales bacterium]